ncbi:MULTISPECIES: histidine phosphatase family protein [unclassified Variovorax]|uniref:histidine phosphatase family protein n=1 Tax=unclassified Variovorax TaxID=663243 RepID=UPI0025764E64|nr:MULTISPECIES: histidine phosphatase family protein [unclassified Variovorax]MDM0087039.1 histidine phosphatase family protein [Variovorax sp. J22G40]MDM0144704.1 histidine phosphatase family protein [Variovorax sp. J2P1-31]
MSTTTAHFTQQHPAGFDELVRLAAAEPISPACDHFYFLRHGQTGRNASRIFQAVDEPLSELGRQQAVLAAERLTGEPIRTIVCSDARRAFDTAHTVAASLRIVPLAREDLRERHFGALIGTSSVNLDWACAPEGGETLPQFVDRNRLSLADALAQPAPVLVVAHGGTLYVLAALLGVAIEPAILGNAQPLRFERVDGRWQVKPLLARTGDAAALA